MGKMAEVDAIAALPIQERAQRPPRKEPAGTRSAQHPGAFARALGQAVAGDGGSVRFSIHAQQRLSGRAIPFGRSQLRRLEEAVDKAASKGGRDSLILMDELALIVNIKNRIVVTAIDRASRREGVFTNIDTVVMT